MSSHACHHCIRIYVAAISDQSVWHLWQSCCRKRPKDRKYGNGGLSEFPEFLVYSNYENIMTQVVNMTWQCCLKFGVDDYVLTMHTIVHYSCIFIHVYSAGRRLQLILAICIAMTIVALFLLLLYFGSPLSYFSHQQSWVLYSPSLPDYVSHFSGREKEINDIVHWLDPQNTAVRIVSIVGPPGFGKSSLAIQVGHEMIDYGVVVNYVNLDELTLEDLPGKIVANAGITTKNGSFERLQNWARNDISFPVLLILDNCDEVLYKQKKKLQNFLQSLKRSATMEIIKFLLTAKHKINLVDDFEELSLGEISFEASCKLLCNVAKRKVDEQSCKAVTQQTGRVPLALKVVGAILRTRTRNISEVVEKLENQFLETLNPLDMDQRVNASLTVSYSYLSERQKKLGEYLSLLPGSFAGKDACSILKYTMDYDCQFVDSEITSLEQTSLLQSLDRGRYQFHKIIKAFFATKGHIAGINYNDFWKGFLSHYKDLIYSLSSNFNKDYRSSLQTLDIEKHNFHHILGHIEELCLLEAETSFLFLQSVIIALQTRFLTCRFSKSELIQPLIAIRNCSEQILDTKTLSDVTVMDALTALATEQYTLDKSLESLEYMKTLIEKFEGIITVPGSGDIYHLLASHYHAIGELEKEKRCHEKILLLANATLENCHYGSCGYRDLSSAYYNLGNFEIAGKFAELDIKHNQDSMSVYVLVKMLHLLYECQEITGNHTEARNTFNKLLQVLPSIYEINISEVYSKFILLSKVASFLRNNGRTKEARLIERKQIIAIKEMNATDTSHEFTLYFQAGNLALELSKAEEYSEVIELAECAFKFYKEINHTTNILLLLQILAEAKYYSGQNTASVQHLNEAIEYSFSDLNLHYDKAKKACRFLLSMGRIHICCIKLFWMDFKQFVYVIVFSDTVSADIFSFTSINDNGNYKASTDISLSSDHLEFITIPARSFFVTLIEALFQLITHLFTSIFSITNLVYAINIIFIVLKIILLFCISWCICCCCICNPLLYIVKILIFVTRTCLHRFVFV